MAVARSTPSKFEPRARNAIGVVLILRPGAVIDVGVLVQAIEGTCLQNVNCWPPSSATLQLVGCGPRLAADEIGSTGAHTMICLPIHRSKHTGRNPGLTRTASPYNTASWAQNRDADITPIVEDFDWRISCFKFDWS